MLKTRLNKLKTLLVKKLTGVNVMVLTLLNKVFNIFFALHRFFIHPVLKTDYFRKVVCKFEKIMLIYHCTMTFFRIIYFTDYTFSGVFFMEQRLKAYAKINLTLDLTGVLPNKYHGIFTCMQSVGLYDSVNVRTGEKGLKLRCSEKYIPCDDRNTAYKAARLFYERAGLEPECDIYIKKLIPSGAGLAGGSADAAAVLKALGNAYPGRLSHKELLKLCLEVGADVPFCYVGGTKLCQNIGEIMSPLPPLKSNVLIVKPFERVSTKDAYQRFDSAESISHPDNDSFLFYAARGEYEEAVKYASNMFEVLSSVPSGKEIKETMLSGGAWYSSMSGSGSAYFGLFGTYDEAKKCSELFNGRAENVFVCTTKSKGIE